MARYKSRTRPFHVPISSPITDLEDSGVQLDEPSSPMSKHFETNSVDINRQSCKEKTNLTNVVKSSHCDNKWPTQTFIFAEDYKKSLSQSDNLPITTTHKHSSIDVQGNEFNSILKKKSEVKSQDVSVTFTLDEDEGLDIRDSNSSINKGDYSSNHYLKYNSDSSNENSDTERSENVGSIELSDLSLKDGNRNYSTDDTRKCKSKDVKRKRFHRLIRKPVIKRSQSLGCEKDLAPEHALFLQYSPRNGTETDEKDQTASKPRTIYKTTSADAAMMAQDVLPLDTPDCAKSKPISSLAKNVKRKLQKLHRRNTDSFLGAAIMSVRGTKVTQAEALEWGKSFESLLMDKNGLEMFKNFLKSEFSDENIEFWIACEEFKTTRTNKLTTRVQKIYSDFVAVNAPRQINLDSKTRLETITHMENPTRDLFQQAQKRIQFLMENDSYKRFLETETYKTLIRSSTAGAST